jgi:hypothetical protein
MPAQAKETVHRLQVGLGCLSAASMLLLSSSQAASIFPQMGSPASNQGACAEVPTAAVAAIQSRTGAMPVLMFGPRSFMCSCGVRTLTGSAEQSRLVGGAEGSKLVGGAEGAKLVGANEGSKLVGGAEGSKLVGGAEGSKLVGGAEGSKLVGAGEGASLVGAGEGAKLVGAGEGAKLVGGQTQLSCRTEPGCAGFRLLGLGDRFDVIVQASGRVSHAPASCVVW